MTSAIPKAVYADFEVFAWREQKSNQVLAIRKVALFTLPTVMAFIWYKLSYQNSCFPQLGGGSYYVIVRILVGDHNETVSRRIAIQSRPKDVLVHVP